MSTFGAPHTVAPHPCGGQWCAGCGETEYLDGPCPERLLRQRDRYRQALERYAPHVLDDLDRESDGGQACSTCNDLGFVRRPAGDGAFAGTTPCPDCPPALAEGRAS